MRFEEPVHTIYKTTNLVNEKFYIGYHKTKNLEDNYLGSGKVLRASIHKYGRESFKKETLFIFDNSKDAYEKEYEIVEIYRGKDPLCMNIQRGGTGHEPTERAHLKGKDPEFRAKLAKQNFPRYRKEKSNMGLGRVIIY